MKQGDLHVKLRLLTFGRIIFTTLLLSSTIILQFSKFDSLVEKPLLALYGLIAGIFLLSFFYSLLLNYIKRITIFAYIQISIDTLFVTIILFMTGGFGSIFPFLYLMVIIYASILLYQRGSMITAFLCSTQYAIVIGLEFYNILSPLLDWNIPAVMPSWSYVLYKIITFMVACFAVAFLSSLLAEQARESKKDLAVMEEHVKRMEKMVVVGEMAAGLAHEIKNPLASLRGSVQMLLEEIQCDPMHDKLIKIVLREADRLEALVSDFLLFARPPKGHPENVDFSKIISEVIELFQQDHKHSQISMVKDIATDIWIKIDSSHLRQILWNLLNNAAEALSIPEQGEIKVKLASQDHQAVLKIYDNGQGIPWEILDSIFDPFFTTKSNGTGLGLSIAVRIIEHHNGRLYVDSTVNQGTTFTLVFKRGTGS